MTKNITILIIITLLSPGRGFALADAPADKGEVKGKVVDATAITPLEYATVAIFNQDSTLVTGGITDANGDFSFKLDPGNYYMEIQFISYEAQTISGVTIDNNRTRLDVGRVSLEPVTTNLSEVTVQAEKSEMVIGVDRKIFNVGKDLGNTGNSAAEILDNIPTVAVDSEGNITLRGSGGVRVLIDGKPSGLVNSGDAESLRALQGNMIDRVEVITNPSARYEAKGMSGIINIVLKKDQRKGVHGSFEVSGGHPPDYTLGANVNFRREKINYFFNYGVNYSERQGDGMSDQLFPRTVPLLRTQVDRERLRTGWSHNLRGGADFFITPRTTVTLAALVNFDDENNRNRINYFDFRDNETAPFRSTQRLDREKETERNIEFSMNFEKVFSGDEHKFTALMQYLEDSETEDSQVQEDIFSGEGSDGELLLQRVLNEESEKDWLVKADYVLPFAEEGRFEAGLRGEFRTIANPYRVEENQGGNWQELPDFTNNFDYSEDVAAIYLQGANKFGPVAVQLGLRAEYSDIGTFLEQGNRRNNRSYTDFFPSIFTTYSFSNVSSWQISYSRRINRPHFWNLNPFYGYSDSRNIRTGNPDLDPEYTDSYESGYVYTPGRNSFYTGVYYRYTTGVIERVSFVDETGTTFVVPQNLAERHAYGAETNFSLMPFKWWDLSTNVNFYRMQTDGIFERNGNVTDLSSDTWSWDTRVNSRMRWENDLSFQTTFFYRGKQKSAQGIRRPFYMLNASLSKDVLKGNGTITLNVRDVLNSRKFRYDIDQPDLISTNEFRWSSRQFRLSFAYRLNQTKKPGRGGGNGNGGGEPDMGF